MKPTMTERTVISNGSTVVGQFGISVENQIHIMTILRDTLYTNKPLAVLREYGSNAWDAHRMVGKADVPIKVTLPTDLDSSLTIRDWGPGLSEYDVVHIYSQYGASTKRDSNTAVGMLGIGSKSAFAYNDSFTITSYFGGLKKVFHAVLDATSQGEVHKFFEGVLGSHLQEYVTALGFLMEGVALSDTDFVDLEEFFTSPLGRSIREHLSEEEPLLGYLETVEHLQLWMAKNHPDTETGIEIKVPVNPQDIPAFIRESERLFRYYRPMPIINMDLVKPPATWQNEHGHLRRSNEHPHEEAWVAVMGCVAYRLNLDQVWPELQARGLTHHMTNLRGALYFDIGEVQVVASREDLEYRQQTKDAIVSRFECLLEALTDEIDTIISDDTLDNWSRRLRIREFAATTGLAIPERHKKWANPLKTLYTREPIKDDLGNPVWDDSTREHLFEDGPQTFILKKMEAVHDSRSRKFQLVEEIRIRISPRTRILVKDTLKSVRGYLESFDLDYVVSIKEGNTPEQAVDEVLKYVREAGLEGVPVLRMSEMTHTPYEVSEYSRNLPNQKHRETCFKLMDPPYTTHTHTLQKLGHFEPPPGSR